MKREKLIKWRKEVSRDRLIEVLFEMRDEHGRLSVDYIADFIIERERKQPDLSKPIYEESGEVTQEAWDSLKPRKQSPEGRANES